MWLTLLKKSLIKIIKILGIAFTVLYPFVVFYALKKHLAVRALALLLLTVGGISFVRNKNKWLFLCVLLCGIGLIICNNDIFLKIYPVLMNISVCLMFALSLHDVPLIEKFALKTGHKLNFEQRKYTRAATRTWAIFMLCLTMISLATVFLSNEIWVMFNGLISYILIAIMMGVEFIVRKKVKNANTDK